MYDLKQGTIKWLSYADYPMELEFLARFLAQIHAERMFIFEEVLA